MGHERYFFNAYFRKVEEKGEKELRLKGQRQIKSGDYDALADRLDRLGKEMQPTSRPGPLMLTAPGASPSKGAKMDGILAELEQSQIPITTALKDVVK